MIFRVIHVFAVFLCLHVVTGAPTPFRGTAALKAAAHFIHRTGNRNGNVVGKMRKEDWPNHSHGHNGEMVVHPDKTHGLSYRTHPPSVVNKKSAHYAIDEHHFKGTGLEVVHDAGTKKPNGEVMPVGHASLVWAGPGDKDAEELKKIINGIHAEHGTLRKGDSKEPNKLDPK